MALLAWQHAVTPLPAPCRPQDAKRGFSAAAVFIARNRFAVLDKAANALIIKDLGNEVCGAGQGKAFWECRGAGTVRLLV